MKNLNQIILEELQKAGMVPASTVLNELESDEIDAERESGGALDPDRFKPKAAKKQGRGEKKDNLVAFKTKASTVYVPKVVELLRGLEEKYGEEEVNVERYVDEFVSDFNDLFDEYFTKFKFGYTGEIALGSLSGTPDSEAPAEEAPAEEEPSAPEDDAPEEEGGDEGTDEPASAEMSDRERASREYYGDPVVEEAELQEAGSRSERAAGSGAGASGDDAPEGGSAELKQAYSEIVRIRRQIYKELTKRDIHKYLRVRLRRQFLDSFSGLFDDLQNLYKELMQKFPEGPTPGPGPDPDPEEETGTGDDSGHVPLFKYAQAKEPVVDPKTGEKKMKRKQPLSSKLAKAGLPKHAINTVMRNIKAQLQANDIQFTESTIKRIETLLTERLLLSERRLEWGEEHQDKVDALAKAHDLKPGEAKKIDKKLRHHLKGFESKDKKGQPKAIAMNKDGDVRLYKDPNAEKEAALHAETGEGKPAEPEPEAKEKIGFAKAPEKFLELGGTQEEWDMLPSGKKGEGKITEDTFKQGGEEGDPIYPGVEPDRKPSTEHALNKLTFFKLMLDAPEDADIKSVVLQQFEPKGTDPKKVVSNMKAFIGAMKNKMKQVASGKAAKERGIDPEKGTFKISTMNQQLQTVDPPLDKGARKEILGLVQKHLAPYLKAAGIKLSEQQVKIIRDRLLQELKTRDLLK